MLMNITYNIYIAGKLIIFLFLVCFIYLFLDNKYRNFKVSSLVSLKRNCLRVCHLFCTRLIPNPDTLLDEHINIYKLIYISTS